MKRFLAAVTLATAPLLAVATPAAAAPTEHFVNDSGCTYYFGDYEVCNTWDYRHKLTQTPSGNSIERTWGTSFFSVTYYFSSDAPIRLSNSREFDNRVMYKKGELHITRDQVTDVVETPEGPCTVSIYYKFTNGNVQVDDFTRTCGGL